MTNTTIRRFLVLILLVLLPSGRPAESKAAYDPLAVAAQHGPAPQDLTVTDAARQREVPIRVYLPTGKTAVPLLLFSHGLGGSREGSTFLGRHWAARGYVCVFLQHPGSDSSVWKGKPVEQRWGSLQKAANLENLLLRVRDVRVVLDQLERWNKQDGHALQGRLDAEHIGMSGHSFGAITTEAVSGQVVPGGKAVFTDSRIKAAVVFSPSSPQVGTARDAFAAVKMPWMLMTGTKDLAPLMIGKADMKSRLAVFPALPPGGKYELVLDGAEHSVFTDRPLPGEGGQRNPNHHRAILALSTAFWDAWLKNDSAAKDWLDGDGPRSILEKNDRWQRK